MAKAYDIKRIRKYMGRVSGSSLFDGGMPEELWVVDFYTCDPKHNEFTDNMLISARDELGAMSKAMKRIDRLKAGKQATSNWHERMRLGRKKIHRPRLTWRRGEDFSL